MLPYALFAVLVCVFLWRPIFTGRALLPGDYLAQMSPWSTVVGQRSSANGPQWNPLQWDAISQFYPWRVFYARSMRAGHIPLWNPHQFSGTPFLANGQSACLYPFNFAFLIFNTITGFTIFAALHLFLAQVFMYWMMRELGAKELGGVIAAIVFAFSAFMVLWLELPTFVSVAVWLPLAIMLAQRAVERRSVYYGMLCGLALAMTFLAGHFQIAFYVVLATSLFWLWKMVQVWREEGKLYTLLKVIVPFAACALIAILISAPQVLPTMELAANSHRAGGPTQAGYDWFLGNSLPAYRLVTAFAPRFFGDPSQGNYYLLGRVGGSSHVGSAADYMDYGMYAGILPLMLALIALASIRRKYVGFFVLLTVLALLTAVGTPINRLFYFGIPGFSSLGGPNRILLLYLFGIAALAGFGGDACGRRTDRESIPGGAILSAGAVISLLFLYHVMTFGPVFTREFVAVRGLNPAALGDFFGLRPAFLMLGLSLAVCLSCLWRKLRAEPLSWLIVAVIVADLFAFGINCNPTCERSRVYPKTKLTTELQRLTKNGERIAPINPDWSLFETPKAILPPNAAMVYGLYDVQGYDSLYTRAYQSLLAGIEGVDPSPPENGNMVLVKQPVADEILELTSVRSFDRRVFIDTSCTWPVEALESGNEGQEVSPIAHSLTVMAPNQVVLDVSGEGGFAFRNLFLLYPGWKARVTCSKYEWNGSARELKPFYVESSSADYSVIGPCRVKFSFEPYTFRLGLFLMCIGVGALTCVGVYRAARYKNLAKR